MSWQNKPTFDWENKFTIDGVDYKVKFQTMHTGNCGSCLLLNMYFTKEGSNACLKDPEILDKLIEKLYNHKFKSGQGNSEHYNPGSWDYPVVCWFGVSKVNSNTPTQEAELSHTPDFFNWLIKKEIGMVITSPVFTNGRYGGDVSTAHLTQAYFWIPPSTADSHNRKIIEGTGGIFNGKDVALLTDKVAGTTKPQEFENVINRRYKSSPQFKNASEKWAKKQEAAIAKFKKPVKWKKKTK